MTQLNAKQIEKIEDKITALGFGHAFLGRSYAEKRVVMSTEHDCDVITGDYHRFDNVHGTYIAQPLRDLAEELGGYWEWETSVSFCFCPD